MLSLKPKTTLFSLVQLYVAFFLTGMIHTTSFADTSPMRFFLLQAMAITFEGAVISIGGRLGFNRQTAPLRYLGYIWVWCWFLFSMSPFWDQMTRAGFFEPDDSFIIVYQLGTLLGR